MPATIGSYTDGGVTKARLPTDAASAANSAVTAPSGNNSTTPNPYDTSNLPFQGIYNEDQAAANKAYSDAITGLRTQRTGYNLQYGFDDSGNVDPNNPNGLFEQQRGTEARALDTARNNSVGRGIGTIGLGAQDETGLQQSQNADDQSLIGTYRGLLNQNDTDQYSAATDLSSRLIEARRKQIQNAIDSGYFTPQTVPDAPPTDNTTDDVTQPATKPGKIVGPKDALARYLVNNKPAKKKAPVHYIAATGRR